MRKAVMSLPAADKPVWEIRMKGGGVPPRSASCVVSVAVYQGKQCQLAGPACHAGAGVPTPPRANPGHLGLFVSKACILGSR